MNVIENEFLNKIQSAQLSGIKDILIAYKKELGISPEDDIASIDDENKVFELIANESYASLEDFLEKYNLFIAAEKINQATSKDIIEKVVFDEKGAEILGIVFEKIEKVADKKEDILNEILNLGVISSPEELAEKVKAVIDKHIAAEYERTGKTLDIETEFVVNLGRGIDVTIEFSEYVSGMEEIVFVIREKDNVLLEDAEFILAVNGTYKKEQKDGKLKIIFTPKYKKDRIKNIGTLRMKTGENEATLKAKINGYLSYDEGISYLICEEIKEEVIEVTVKANNDKPSRGDYGSGGGSGGSGSSLPSNPDSKPDGSGENGGNVSYDDIPSVTPGGNDIFADLEGASWAKESIEYLYSKNIISGKGDNIFAPNDNVTRAEFCKIIALAFGIADADAESDFADVTPDKWYYQYISSCRQEGLINGKTETEFFPESTVTREEMATIIWRALEKKGYAYEEQEDAFYDDDSISDFAKEAVYGMKNLEIINGMGDNLYMPKESVTRAQTAKVIYETMRKVIY